MYSFLCTRTYTRGNPTRTLACMLLGWVGSLYTEQCVCVLVKGRRDARGREKTTEERGTASMCYVHVHIKACMSNEWNLSTSLPLPAYPAPSHLSLNPPPLLPACFTSLCPVTLQFDSESLSTQHIKFMVCTLHITYPRPHVRKYGG